MTFHVFKASRLLDEERDGDEGESVLKIGSKDEIVGRMDEETTIFEPPEESLEMTG